MSNEERLEIYCQGAWYIEFKNYHATYYLTSELMAYALPGDSWWSYEDFLE